MKLSVIICTHNPREDYLRRVLASLQNQTLSKEQWELLLVDNASHESLVDKWNLSWHPQARHLCEEKTGLTHARLCGITAAQGELLVFVDDDNVLRADYLQAVLKIANHYPWLGAWSGSCLPEYESEPSSELRPWLASVLVIETVSTSLWAKLPKYNEASPVGAGMVVRYSVAQNYSETVSKDSIRQALDRSGSGLGGGGDGDMGLCTFALGYGTGRFPELELVHLIPARRLTIEYFAGVHEGFGYAGEVLQAIHGRAELFPGQIHSSNLRLIMLRIFMLIMRKSRIEQRLRLARERGRLRALRDLKRLGYPRLQS